MTPLVLAGQLQFDGVPVDITTTTNEDLVIAPGEGGVSQVGDKSGGTRNIATTNDDLFITNNLEVEGAGRIEGALTIGGAMTFNGAVTLGDATSDTVTVTGYLGSHLIPATDSTYNLGSTSLAWANLYVDTIASITGNDLALAPISGKALTAAVTRSAATGNEVAYDLAATINKSTSGSYTGLRINVTETAAPGAADRLLDLQVGGTSRVFVSNGATSANYGMLSVGTDDWDGSTSGFFAGSSDGTIIAGNAISGFVGNVLDLQVAGTSAVKVDYAGNLTIPGTLTASGSSTGENLTLTGNLSVQGNTTLGNAAADTVTLNAAAWTFANDTTVVLSGGVDGINFDANTLSIDATNNRVGIGTAAPTQTLEVAGQCVTGDTLLALADGRALPIKDVRGGELVYSLDEATGALVPARINGLLDKGVQPVFKLTTASGRTIRTTGNHPYLTPAGWRKVVTLSVGEAIAVPHSSLLLEETIQLGPEGLHRGGGQRPQRFADEALVQRDELPQLHQRGLGQAGVGQVSGAQDVVARGTPLRDMRGDRRSDDVLMRPVERSGRQDDRRALLERGEVREREGQEDDMARFIDGYTRYRPGYPRTQTPVPPPSTGLAQPPAASADGADPAAAVAAFLDRPWQWPVQWLPARTGFSCADLLAQVWHALDELSSRPAYAAPVRLSDILWDRIVAIEPAGREQVYDIEVEGTHNFVANGILAHNTYLTGNTTIGDASADTVTANAAAWTFANDTAVTLSGGADGINFDSNTLSIDANANMVGFGTNAPAGRVDIAGNISASAWGLSGITFQTDAATYTDSSTLASGTATNAVFTSFAQPTLAATNTAVTTTNAATVYIANAPTAGTNQTLTNAYALWVDNGNVIFDGNLSVGGTQTFTGNTTFSGNLTVNGNTTLGDASTDTITFNAGTLTLANDLAVTLSGGVDGINFDANTLSIDATNDRVGIGTAAPVSRLEVARSVAHSYPTPGVTTGSLHISPIANVNGDSASITFGGNNNGTAGPPTEGHAGIYVESSNVYGTRMHFGTTNSFATGSQVRMTILESGLVGIGATSPDARLELAGNLSQAAWGLNGIQLQSTAATYTDSSTLASGTATNAVFTSFAQPTLAATNTAVTTTNAATVYIANAPTAGTNQTLTNAYALWVDNGNVIFDGNLTVGGTQTFTGNTTFSGNLTVNGNTTLGDASTDTITFNAGTLTVANDLAVTLSGGVDGINFDANTLSVDALNNRVGIGTTTPTGALHLAGSRSAASWTTNGIQLQVGDAILTDTSTAASGTAASAVSSSFFGATLDATNASVTTTDAATVYIQGAPVAVGNMTITNRYALWIDSGNARFDGNIRLMGLSAGATSYSNEVIVAQGSFGTFDVVQSVIAFKEGNTYGADIGFLFDGPGYPLVFSVNDNSTGDPIERMRILNTGVIIVGNGERTTTPVGNTLRGPNASGTNIGGSTLVMAAGLGTGTGNAGVVDFQAAAAKAASGTTAHSLSTIFRIGNSQSAHPGTAGALLNAPAVTWTDANTAASGTATNAVMYGFQQPTLAATNTAVTTTNAATVYIANAPAAGTNQTLTNAYALWVDNGNVIFDGNLTVGGTQTFTGNTTFSGNLSVNGNTTLGDASGDTVTVNAAAWTLANDTTVALSGGVDGLNFDANTLSIDATNNRVGIGTNAPSYTLDVRGSGTVAQFGVSATASVLVNGSTRNLQLGTDGTVGPHIGARPTSGTSSGIGITDSGVLIPIRIDSTGVTSSPDAIVNSGQGIIQWGKLFVGGANTTNTYGIQWGNDAVSSALYRGETSGLFLDGSLAVSAVALSRAAWGVNGIVLRSSASTFTDSSTAASGTATNAVFTSLATPTLAATNTGVTTTNAATFYIVNAPTAGTNQTLTNAYALWVDDGAARFDANVMIGATSAGTSAVNTLAIASSTAPSASITDGIQLFAVDVGGLGHELRVRDEAGNVATLSPHNFSMIPGGRSEPMAWAFQSERDGMAINVDMLKVVRTVEQLSGESLVYLSPSVTSHQSPVTSVWTQLEVQQAQLQALQNELAALRAEVERLRGATAAREADPAEERGAGENPAHGG